MNQILAQLGNAKHTVLGRCRNTLWSSSDSGRFISSAAFRVELDHVDRGPRDPVGRLAQQAGSDILFSKRLVAQMQVVVLVQPGYALHFDRAINTRLLFIGQCEIDADRIESTCY